MSCSTHMQVICWSLSSSFEAIHSNCQTLGAPPALTCPCPASGAPHTWLSPGPYFSPLGLPAPAPLEPQFLAWYQELPTLPSSLLGWWDGPLLETSCLAAPGSPLASSSLGEQLDLEVPADILLSLEELLNEVFAPAMDWKKYRPLWKNKRDQLSRIAPACRYCSRHLFHSSSASSFIPDCIQQDFLPAPRSPHYLLQGQQYPSHGGLGVLSNRTGWATVCLYNYKLSCFAMSVPHPISLPVFIHPEVCSAAGTCLLSRRGKEHTHHTSQLPEVQPAISSIWQATKANRLQGRA